MEDQKDSEFLKTKRVHPFSKANIISKLFFTWLFPLFYKGYHKDLTEDDLFNCLKEQDAAMLGDKLQQQWQMRLKKKNPSLWKALLSVFGCELAWLALLYVFIEFFARLAQPIILSQLLKYYEPDTTMTKNEAYLYSALLVASPALVMLCQHNFMLYQFSMGVKIKVAVTALVYRKVLKLSRLSLAETNVGQMVNLISNDVSRFESAMKHFHSLWCAPLELLLIVVLLYFYVGPSGMTGVLFLVGFMPFQMWLGKKTSVFRLNTALRTDERIRIMNEIISGIQVIKMYTWEKPFAKLVEISRGKEMQQIKKTSIIRAAVFSFHLFLNKIAVYTCIIVYVLTGNILNAQFVYVITSFYLILRTLLTKRFPEGVTHIAEAQISVRRLQNFLMRDEIELDSTNSFSPVVTTCQNGKKATAIASPPEINQVELKNVYVKWNQKFNDYTLEDITMNVASTGLAVIVGPVGSGKTTLLYTILRELPPLKGSTKINGTISYASQEPWLFMGSIRQNILFGQPFDPTRYEEVVRVCALQRDFTLFDYGDKTIVGDRGVSLSGGQRARINLARAIYKEADIYLLDDPLSAVDTHVGKQIFEECIQQYLKNKCVVLVTHQLQYLRNAKSIYLMDNGRIQFSGTHEQIQTSGHDYAKMLVELNNKPEEEGTSDDEAESQNKNSKKEDNIGKKSLEKDKAGPKANKEGKAVGNVEVKVYQTYFRNGGHWCKVVWIFLLFFAAQSMSSMSDYYVSWWVNAEAIRKARGEVSYKNQSIASNATTDHLKATSAPTVSTTMLQELWLTYMTEDLSIIVYSCVVVALTLLALSRSMLFFRFANKASINLHNSMFDKIVYATMRFFNTNPSGRILNRFSTDMNQVDETLPSTMIDCMQNGLTVISTTVVVATVNPWMIIPTVIILMIFYLMRIIYICTSRDVKRMESVTRSPIYSHLTASLQGLTTIRAFGAQDLLSKEFALHQNRNTSISTLFISVGRCFGLWLDFGCVLYICLVTISFLFIKTDTLGGFVGLSITQSMTLTGMFQMFIRQVSELENQMTSVERIKEYVDVVPETDSGTKDPPKSWPSEGKITFKDLSLRYSVDEPPVLKNLTFSVKSKEKVGVVGRTGAGKSSIIIALFRLAENDGLIDIDDVDTKTISLDRLRSSISIIPQEPVLFSGTLRKNLDPFDEYDDKTLWNALEEVELKMAVLDLPHGLESRMSEGGSNFSVGQRQLVCLARALIRNNKILVLDEATANVDPQTDTLIQLTIRRKFSNCTVLTIAHRLHTIMDSDKVLVMDAGRVVEFGSPFELLQNESGTFTGMVEQTGKAMADNLFSIAEKAQHSRNTGSAPHATDLR